MISLSWPVRALSPNARAHWSGIARAKAAAKNQGYWLACAAYGNRFKGAEALTLSITFCPPDNRRRDLDNMVASIKAHIDGISKAIGVDDSKFALRIQRGEVVKDGAVLVEVLS